MLPPESRTDSSSGFSDRLADVVELTAPYVAALHARRTHPSSGLLWQSGVLLTAAHTIRRETDITVVLPDGSTTVATLAGADPATDVGVLRVDSVSGGTARLDDAASVRPGNFVIAVARTADGAVAASAGIVARTGGEWRTWRGGRMDRLIQLDGGLWPGFSGAPIVNMSGQIIGIGTSALARGRAIVIPIAVLRRSGEQLLTHGRVAQPYLGVGTQSVELPARLRARLELQSSHGLLVMSVASPGPAETAGIMLGDVLIALDTLPTPDIESLTTALGRRQIGAVVPLTLLRGGEIATVDVTLGARPHAR